MWFSYACLHDLGCHTGWGADNLALQDLEPKRWAPRMAQDLEGALVDFSIHWAQVLEGTLLGAPIHSMQDLGGVPTGFTGFTGKRPSLKVLACSLEVTIS